MSLIDNLPKQQPLYEEEEEEELSVMKAASILNSTMVRMTLPVLQFFPKSFLKDPLELKWCS